MQRNQRLADAIRQSGRTLDDLAETIGTNRKTVERWVSTGRVPHPTTREKAAAALAVPAAMLWPDAPGAMQATTDLVGIYQTRSEVSPATIRSLLDAAIGHVDVLAFAALWLWDAVPGFSATLAAKSASGVDVRVCLGDPESEAVRLRGEEEGIGEGMAARCRLAAAYVAELVTVDPNAVRVSDSTLYSSIFRFDDDVLVNMHLWGNPAAASPVLHFRRNDDSGVAAGAIASIDRVWDRAQVPAVG